jgi:excisionase family DNA binding protein
VAYNKFLSVKEVSEKLNLAPKTIRRMASEGAIPAKKVGRQWRFSESALHDFMEADQAERTPDDARLARFAMVLSRKQERSSVMRKSRLPDRLNLGYGGYYKRTYLPAKNNKEGMKRWYIYYWNQDGRKKTEVVRLANSPEDALTALEFRRKQAFEASFCCPNCGANMVTGVMEDKKERILFRDFAKEYVEKYQHEKSLKGVRSRIENHLIPRFGSKALNEIKPKHIDEMIDEMREAGFKSSSINCVLKRLKAVLMKAKEYELIDSVPKIKRQKETDRREGKIIPDDDLQKIMMNAPGYMEKMILTSRLTAFRGHELRTLKWDCVDFKKNQITIRPEYDKASRGKKAFITDELREVFEQLRAEKNGSDFVFTLNGHGVSRTAFNDDFTKAVLDAGFKKSEFRFHDLRHTAISRAAESGIGLKAVMDLAGHSNPDTTKQYLHSDWNQQKRAAQALCLNGRK